MIVRREEVKNKTQSHHIESVLTCIRLDGVIAAAQIPMATNIFIGNASNIIVVKENSTNTNTDGIAIRQRTPVILHLTKQAVNKNIG